MTDFFSADHHFFHKNIILYDSRPWNDVKEMNKALIENHNIWVAPEDNVYFLGDFAMLNKSNIVKIEPILNKLNGHKHLILGNHDEGNPFTYVKLGFDTVHTALQYTDQVYLVHDPACTTINRENVIWFVGHVHDLFKVRLNCINVGGCVWNYVPQTFRSLVRSFFEYNNLVTSGIKDILASLFPEIEEVGVEFDGKKFWYEYTVNNLAEFKKDREFVPIEEIVGKEFPRYIRNFCYIREVK